MYKRFWSRIEKARETELEFIEVSSDDAQSLYAGRKPNCIRIYDKIAELQKQWRKIVTNYQRFNQGQRIPQAPRSDSGRIANVIFVAWAIRSFISTTFCGPPVRSIRTSTHYCCPPTAGGSASPQAKMNRGAFWAQGMSAGLQYRF